MGTRFFRYTFIESCPRPGAGGREHRVGEGEWSPLAPGRVVAAAARVAERSPKHWARGQTRRRSRVCEGRRAGVASARATVATHASGQAACAGWSHRRWNLTKADCAAFSVRRDTCVEGAARANRHGATGARRHWTWYLPAGRLEVEVLSDAVEAREHARKDAQVVIDAELEREGVGGHGRWRGASYPVGGGNRIFLFFAQCCEMGVLL